MITLLVLEDEIKIHKLLSEALAKEGYFIFNQPQTAGAVKIVRKASFSKDDLLSSRFLDLTDILIKYRSGEVYKALLAEVEKPLIESALKRTEGNKIRAARILGINRNTLDAKMKKLGIDVDRFKIY